MTDMLHEVKKQSDPPVHSQGSPTEGKNKKCSLHGINTIHLSPGKTKPAPCSWINYNIRNREEPADGENRQISPPSAAGILFKAFPHALSLAERKCKRLRHYTLQPFPGVMGEAHSHAWPWLFQLPQNSEKSGKASTAFAPKYAMYRQIIRPVQKFSSSTCCFKFGLKPPHPHPPMAHILFRLNKKCAPEKDGHQNRSRSEVKCADTLRSEILQNHLG